MTAPLLLALLLALGLCLPDADKVSSPPGMIDAKIHSGYLNTNKSGRQIHYVFVQVERDDPLNSSLTVWLNGGPGCSSLIGMMQEIGPYLVGNEYKQGDQLNKNEYRWSKVSNLLFLESPAIVGFSSESNTTYPWTDEETAADALAAIKDFLFVKAPEMSTLPLFISGQSYAGKYIPDIADLILRHNSDHGWTEEDLYASEYINIKGILVGNGVMSFEDHSLQKSSIEYMMGHEFLSHRLEDIYKLACNRDFKGPRCRFFRFQYEISKAFVNPYSIYEVCEHKSTEGIRLLTATSPKSAFIEAGLIMNSGLQQIPACPSDQGMQDYWNLNKVAYHVQKYNKTWSPCSHINYHISERGSMSEYRRILFTKSIRIWLFSGDADDVVPFTDTKKNVDALHQNKAGWWTAWNTGDQHAGFYQNYVNNFTVLTVKGAGHMVPQTRPKAAYQMFSNFANGHPVNYPVFSVEQQERRLEMEMKREMQRDEEF